LKINCPLIKPGNKVRVLVIVEDEDEDEKDDKGCWLSSVSNIPAFDFLAEEGENI